MTIKYHASVLVGIVVTAAGGLVWSQDDTIQDDNADGFLDFEEGDTIYARDINANFSRTAEHINLYEAAVSVTSEGSVGIGTTDPQSRLDVAGGISAESFDTVGVIAAGFLEITGTISGDGSLLTNLDGRQILDLDAGKITSGTMDPLRLGTGTPTSSTYLKGDGTWGIPDGSNPWLISGADISYTGGNVGIGTSPISVLDIQTDSNIHAYFATAVAGIGQIPTTDKELGAGLFFTRPSSGATGVAGIYVSDNNNLAFEANANFRFITGIGPSEVMRISEDGNVGIGTMEPTSPLEVRAGADLGGLGVTTNKFTHLSSGSRLRFWHGAAEGDTYAIIENLVNGGTTIGSLALNPSGGNVGIGTTSPEQNLDVANNIRASQFVANSNNVETEPGQYSPTRMVFRFNEARGIGYNSTDDAIYFAMTDATAMVIQKSGNVGIGTTSPSYALHVGGTVAATSYVTTSDARLKRDIEALENAPEAIDCLQGVTYRGIDRNDGSAAKSPDREIGLIAQEVELCLPEVVDTDARGFKSVAYDRLVVPLIEHAKVQQQRIDELETRLNRLETLLQER